MTTPRLTPRAEADVLEVRATPERRPRRVQWTFTLARETVESVRREWQETGVPMSRIVERCLRGRGAK
jgi:hypothetical protein